MPGTQAPPNAGFPPGTGYQGPLYTQGWAWGFSITVPPTGLDPFSGQRATERDVWEPCTFSVQMPTLAANSPAIVQVIVGSRRGSISATRLITVPAWGIAIHCGSGFATCDILSPGLPPSDFLVYAGVAIGRPFTEWLGVADIVAPPGPAFVTLTPVPFARRLTISVLSGSLATPALASGQTLTVSAAVRQIVGGPAGATVSVAWEVVAP
jgi:hypothetical protein